MISTPKKWGRKFDTDEKVAKLIIDAMNLGFVATATLHGIDIQTIRNYIKRAKINNLQIPNDDPNGKPFFVADLQAAQFKRERKDFETTEDWQRSIQDKINLFQESHVCAHWYARCSSGCHKVLASDATHELVLIEKKVMYESEI